MNIPHAKLSAEVSLENTTDTRDEGQIQFEDHTLPILIKERAKAGKRDVTINFHRREGRGHINALHVYGHKISAIRPLTSLLHPLGYVIDQTWDDYALVIRW